MANEEHLAILKKGVEEWNEWRAKNPGIYPDLSGANLSGANLFGANLDDVNLHEANLAGAKLGRARLHSANIAGGNLQGADLNEADLNRADLRRADLRGFLYRTRIDQANLREANLSKACLIGANFQLSALDGADLSGAELGYTLLVDVDLSAVKGLETIWIYEGPSTIGIDTIYNSKGNIPEVFLRKVGVPEPFIANMKALVAATEPIQFYSCFISYSTEDEEFAQRLYADLQAKNVRCYFARHDVRGGKKLHEQIDEAIRVHDKVLLILSVESMASEWVKTEIAKARKRELREKKQVLFPVRLVPFEKIRDWECFDADMGKDSAREIREYLIPDFSQWKDHDKYKEALERLLKDLKSSGA